jgi:hypothetical protein
VAHLTERELLELAGPKEDDHVFAVELDGEVFGLVQAGGRPTPTTATPASTSS